MKQFNTDTQRHILDVVITVHPWPFSVLWIKGQLNVFNCMQMVIFISVKLAQKWSNRTWIFSSFCKFLCIAKAQDHNLPIFTTGMKQTLINALKISYYVSSKMKSKAEVFWTVQDNDPETQE